MHGLMQHEDLLVSSIIRHAALHHGRADVASRLGDAAIHRTDYASIDARARRLIGVLESLGVAQGDRVATLAWNSFRHLELYYGTPGMGAVCHTINPRLAIDDIAYIVDHAGDVVVFADSLFLPLLARVLPLTSGTVRAVVALDDDAPEADFPEGVAVLGYEALLRDAVGPADWPRLDERTACGLCYTSGTTGRPRGVLYSHRSTVLHAMALNAAGAFCLGRTERVLPAVPMFHVNAWGLPYVAPMVGAALVMPGRHLDGASLAALMQAERVTFATGVPTVWLGLLKHFREGGAMPDTLRRVGIGGSACPGLIIDEFAARGVEVIHAWGMTETSPVVTCNAGGLPDAESRRRREKVGRVLFGAELRALDAEARDVPRDGATQGNVVCRGHWIAERYFGDAETACVEGWLPTGDVGTIDEDGLVALTDRTKDLIKSGGEWISSIQLENIALLHPDVAEAAVIAARHPTWTERPLLIVAAKPDRTIDPAALLLFFDGQVPTWWRPDGVLVLDELPHGATGKLQKSVLRERHADHLLDATSSFRTPFGA